MGLQGFHMVFEGLHVALLFFCDGLGSKKLSSLGRAVDVL